MSEKQSPKTWGTWEELLLACAVKRHGCKNWESVAMELQTKTSLPHLLTTAQCCKQKYQDLKRRFKDEHDHEQEQDSNNNNKSNNSKLFNIPWLEQLRKSRVDELKQEVQRYDLSILSLQLKVKKLEEERDHAASLDIAEQKPDLLHHNISATDKKDEPQKSSEEAQRLCKRLVSGEESDRENRSVNESNSTGLSEKNADGELINKEEKGVGSGGLGPVQSGWKAAEAEVESEELGDSATQLSSDVQSSASFGRKRKRGCGDSIKADVKSEPLIRLLNLIRTHKHASLFESQLKSQESSKYREVVRQHVDVETIQRRVEKGTYSSSSILTFYRDVLLLFNNAIVYFPKNSLEFATAFQLRSLVSSEIKKETLKSDSSLDPPLPPSSSLPPQPPKPTLLECSDSLLAKQKSSAPLIVCRKRSSVSAKQSQSQSPSSDHIHDKDQKPPPVERTTSSTSLLKLKTEDNNNNKAITTGARSSRRSNRNPTPTNKKQNANSGSGSGSGSGSKAAPAASINIQDTTTSKAGKKKSEALDKKKSVVDFLKRIKKNSPVQRNKSTMKKGKGGGGEEQPKRNNNNNSGHKDKGKERASWKNSSEKKQVNEESTDSPSRRTIGRPAKKRADASGGKRGRESGGKEMVVVKRQSKRARR